MTECRNEECMIKASLDCEKRKNKKTVDRLSRERKKKKKKPASDLIECSSYTKDILVPHPLPIQVIDNDVISDHMITILHLDGHSIQTFACQTHC